MTSKPLRSIAGLASSVALVTGGIALSTTVADAVEPVTAQCPAVFPAADLVARQAVTGLTTTHGTSPEAFSGEYVDTLKNGIGFDKDLLVFKMRGSRITKADGSVDAGIWAGMSGSPVYASDGRLIGAVSYGFSLESSDYAGVTPAQYMYDLRSAAASASRVTAPAPKTVKLTSALKTTVVEDGVTAKAAAGGLRQLQPVRIATGPGLNSNIASRYARKAGFDYKGYRAGSGFTATAPDYPIEAGGNLATSFSYGDITLASIGTATAVCGAAADDVLAFGHPAEFSGKSTNTIHGASAAFVQRDNVAGSYKLANVGAPSGSLLQDRLQGILGKLGDTPPTITVESDTTAAGNTRHGQTLVSFADALSYVTALQVSTDTVIALNQDAAGEAIVSWSIDFKRKNGRTQTFSRTQRYSATAGLAYQVPNDVAADVDAIVNNGLERVSVTKVHITNKLSSDYRIFKVTKVDHSSKGAWHRVGNGSAITIKPGSRVKLRLTFGGGDTKTDVTPKTRIVIWSVAPNARRSGVLTLTGNVKNFGKEADFGDELAGYFDEYRPKSLDELLAVLAAEPRNDNIAYRLSLRTKSSGLFAKTGIVRAPGIIRGKYTIRLVIR